MAIAVSGIAEFVVWKGETCPEIDKREAIYTRETKESRETGGRKDE